MRLAPISLLLCMAVSGCGFDSVPTIASIIDQHEELNGKTVRAQGWIVGCQPQHCLLTENANGSGKTLSLGGSQAFDQALLKSGGAVIVVGPDRRVIGNPNGFPLFVEIEGIVDRNCFLHKGEQAVEQRICLDRADQIRSPRLIQVIKTGPAPKQGR